MAPKPALDFSGITIDHDVQLTSERQTKAAAAYDQLLDRMQTGDSVVLDNAQAFGLARRGRARDIEMATRIETPDTRRVWKQSTAPAAEPAIAAE